MDAVRTCVVSFLMHCCFYFVTKFVMDYVLNDILYSDDLFLICKMMTGPRNFLWKGKIVLYKEGFED